MNHSVTPTSPSPQAPAARAVPAALAARTHRRDVWWAQPLGVFLGLSAFVVYSTWAAFQNAHYFYTGGGAHYLSPMYSPDLSGLDLFPAWLPLWFPRSPALLILWAPAGFRLTCYYYRKAYYRSFALKPPACAVGGPQSHSYRGETAFPLILQNAHRYFLYLALAFIVVLWYDGIRALFFGDGFGVGVGTLVLCANAFLLSCYTLGCHSLRHLIGGRLDCFSCSASSRIRHSAWSWATVLNMRHQLWAWLSLIMVGFADLYVRLCSMGVWHDMRIL